MKRFLSAQDDVCTKKQLQRALDRFVAYYNEVRPHRELGRKTPASVYSAREKAAPTGAVVKTDGRRLRFDKVDKSGSVTLRYRGRLHHIGIGAAYKGWRIAMLIDDRKIESSASMDPRYGALFSIQVGTINLCPDQRVFAGLGCLDTSVSDVSRHHRVEAKGLEPSNLLTASQALYQLSYAPEGSLTLPAGRWGSEARTSHWSARPTDPPSTTVQGDSGRPAGRHAAGSAGVRRLSLLPSAGMDGSETVAPG